MGLASEHDQLHLNVWNSCKSGIAFAVLQIHWFSIINSCVTVLLLTGFLATILMRVLKNDFIKFMQDEETGLF